MNDHQTVRKGEVRYIHDVCLFTEEFYFSYTVLHYAILFSPKHYSIQA